jgi:stringent starvation protein B
VETSQTPAPRTPLFIDVEFRRNYARENGKGTLRNISITGAFLEFTNENFRVGEKVFLKFQVASRERTIQAMVVWSNEKGSGIKFLPSNNRDVQIVDDLIYFVESKRGGTKDILDQIFKKVA